MDYEKAYNEALERAKYYYTKGYFMINSPLEKIFPELKESEDERIRKALIDYFDDAIKADVNPLQSYGTHPNKVIDWLEKQKSVGEIVERCKNSWYNEGKIAGQFEGITDDEKYQQGWHDALEKQGEQKPTWSDEDENVLEDIEEAIINYWHGDTKIFLLDWLKSLKERLKNE